MTITNNKTGEFCTMTFKPKGWWGKGYGEVEGIVYDRQKEAQFKIFGNWNDKLQYVPISAADSKDARPHTLWKRNANVTGADKFYNFTAFAFELNELFPELEKKVDPSIEFKPILSFNAIFFSSFPKQILGFVLTSGPLKRATSPRRVRRSCVLSKSKGQTLSFFFFFSLSSSSSFS